MARAIIHEAMRVGGKKVFAEKTFNVCYPYTGEVIGTVPTGSASHAAKAFEIAAASRFCSALPS
jgi:phosphonoacetaldehyde dehydrogenase